MKKITRDRKIRRKRRISNNIFGSGQRPRICVFRSNKYIYAQAIDDEKRITLASYSSTILTKAKESEKLTKGKKARLVGVELANILKKMKIETGVFDRGAYAYNGRVKALAEGIREGGFKI